MRAYTLKRQGLTTLTVTREVAKMVTPQIFAAMMKSRLGEGQKIVVAARGITPVLTFAMDEAKLRNATLCVLYVKEVAIYYTAEPATRLGRARWQDDPRSERDHVGSVMNIRDEERGVSESCRSMPSARMPPPPSWTRRLPWAPIFSLSAPPSAPPHESKTAPW